MHRVGAHRARGLQHAGLAVLRACAEALGLPRETFAEATRGASHVTRALRYLPLDEAQIRQGALWGEEHTDFNLLTLLPGGWFLDAARKRCSRPHTRWPTSSPTTARRSPWR